MTDRWRPREFDERCERLAWALVVKRGLFAPGMTDEDLVQEARVGIWEAIAAYRPERGGSFAAFAVLCGSRQVYDAIGAANRQHHRLLNEAVSLHCTVRSVLPDGADIRLVDALPASDRDPHDLVAGREQLAAVIDGILELTPFEQTAMVRCVIGGERYEHVGGRKSIDNAAQRARRKLRAHLKDRDLLEAA